MSIFKPASAHKYHFGKSFKRLEVRSIVQSFRERLEKSQISPQTGSTDILSRLQVLQPQSNYTGPLDVSVGKTWGTNLVAAARRDAKFVPFRLLTTKAESPFPQFASAQTSPTSNKTPQATPGVAEAGMKLTGHLTREDLTAISGEDADQVVARIWEATPEAIPEILVELARSGRFSTLSDRLIEGLTAYGLMQETRGTLRRYSKMTTRRLEMAIERIHPWRTLLKGSVLVTRILSPVVHALMELLPTFGLTRESENVRRSSERIRAANDYLFSEPKFKYHLWDSEITKGLQGDPYSPLRDIIVELYFAMNHERVLQLLSKAMDLDLAKADYKMIQMSSLKIKGAIRNRLRRIAEKWSSRNDLDVREVQAMSDLIDEGSRLIAFRDRLGIIDTKSSVTDEVIHAARLQLLFLELSRPERISDPHNEPDPWDDLPGR